jgi:hypothetical protein
VSLPRCEHGASGDDGRYKGLWLAPFSKCGCCGVAFPYVEAAAYSEGGSAWGRLWTPKDRCSACGGRYEEAQATPTGATP